MPNSEDPLATALGVVEAYCRSRVPEQVRDKISIECTRRGNAITIVERRPPWNPDFGPEWSSQRVAQLPYDPDRGTWTLHGTDSRDRWFRCDEIAPADDVVALLVELENDRTGIFWG